MVKLKRGKSEGITIADKALFLGGIVSITLLGIYVYITLFLGSLGFLLLEIGLYVALLTIYCLTFWSRSTNHLLMLLSRIISVFGISVAALMVIFIIYFVTTFQW